MQLRTLTLGVFQTNCYILRQETRSDCLVIDPGDSPMKILHFLRQESLTPAAILLTHGHFDHVGGVKTLAGAFSCPVYLNEKETALPGIMTAGPLHYTHSYGQGDTLALAGFTVQVMETPGHTPGSVCLLIEDCMFSGDTLFAGSCGRVDFPGSSRAAMLWSLAALAALPDNYTLYPGHGESSTLSHEQKNNPYMRGAL